MDQELKSKYEKSKLIVVKWEKEFRKSKNRIPSKLDLEDAPREVKWAYKLYYKLKTQSLTQTLSDDIGDTDNFNDDDSETFEMSTNGSTLNISSAINDLLDPDNSMLNSMDQSVSKINETAWSDDLLVKQKTKEPGKLKKEQGPQKLAKKFSFNIEHAVVKPPRNPRKGLSRPSSMNESITTGEADKSEELPDLETILLQKSRTAPNPDNSNSVNDLNNIVNNVDKGWLNRNSSFNGNEKANLTQTQSTLSVTSSFGLSNLNMKSFSSSSSLNIAAMSAEVKFHVNDASDGEIIGNSDDDESEKPTKPFLHVAKKRRLSAEIFSNEDIEREIDDKIATSNGNLESEYQQSVQEPKQMRLPTLKEDGDFDGDDDSDKDPTFEEPSPPVMRRKRSLVKRSKDGITKVAKKATQLLTRGKKTVKTETDTDNVDNKEEELNFLIDSDISTVTTTPRVSSKEMKSTEALLDEYLKNDKRISNTNTKNVVDAKTTAKKVALHKKIAAGTLNENYVRVNLKKKVFIRGKKSFSFSKYKKGIWKSKKAAALAGPEMDMRGCDGGVLVCHSCGGVGHFAQQCKKKCDNLLPLDADIGETSEFPSLEQAAQMADDRRLVVHSSKPENLPTSSNQIWKENFENLEVTDDDDEDVDMESNDKENQDNNVENVPSTTNTTPNKFMGQKIPEDFLLKSGLLDKSVGGKDQVESVYSLTTKEKLPKTPKEVFQALKLFGHESFRSGQEQAIMRVLCGVSTLVTLSTGSGKSLCYQLPAYLYRKKSHCITLVVSPLVSLMEDQVHGIPDFINAQCLHTNQTPKQRDKIMEQIKSGKVEILLVSPEAIVAGEKSTGFGSLLRELPPIAFACIDEAHCVSQWSHNFRPSYLMICRVLREKLGVKTILGLTATATIHTRESIVNHLGIPDGLNGIISDIPLPDNLILTVSKDENRDRALLALLRSERFAQLQSIIVYCTRREECERISGILRTSLQENAEPAGATASKKRKRINWSAEAYHAGLPASRRRTIQNAFMSSELRIVVATVAFGMGINKADIRGIIHYNMPKSFENYVQEVGRAGRDGKQSHCHVFLDSRGNDLSELRRHIYANSIDRHVIRKLLRNVFVPCACGQQMRKSSDKERNCKGHEVSFSVDGTVQSLDIPEENIATLLCYLELHEKRYIKVLGNAYTKCKIISYGGPNYLKQAAKNCPPLAMAIAMSLRKSESTNVELSSIEFDVIEVAAAIGWDSGVVKYQLKQLEWTVVNGTSKRSLISTSFSDLGFRIRSPGDLTDDELDSALDTLSKRADSQESTQLYQLQVIFNSFSSLAFAKYNLCCTDDFPKDSSDKLKELIRNYFQTSLPENIELPEDGSDTSDNEIMTDIRQMISMYPENNFSGRALARLFHGISSPCYPAVVWGRCKYWRAHMNVSFKRLVTLGNSALVKMRTSLE